jgi:hypothetical protein
MQQLKVLDASSNLVSGIGVLQHCPLLETVSLYDNLIQNWTPLTLNPSIKKAIVTEEQACEEERLAQLASGVLHPHAYQVMQKSNFAPQYRVAGDRKSGIQGWFLCTIAVDTF